MSTLNSLLPLLYESMAKATVLLTIAGLAVFASSQWTLATLRHWLCLLATESYTYVAVYIPQTLLPKVAGFWVLSRPEETVKFCNIALDPLLKQEVVSISPVITYSLWLRRRVL